MVYFFFFLLVSVQFTMSSQSALMPTMNFGEICLFKKKNLNNFIRTPGIFVGDVCGAVFSFFSEDVLPSIHADPEYPCELVGTWNTWYGEQDQAGKIKNPEKKIKQEKKKRKLQLYCTVVVIVPSWFILQ